MKPVKVACLMACLMASASVVGVALQPSQRASAQATAPRYVLDDAVPKSFGAWRELPSQGAQVVNPQTKELIDKLYSQVLTRIYVNDADGYRIMLSLAYRDDQRGNLQAHMPELCYPAQGFVVHSSDPATLSTPFGDIEARQLRTSMGARKEPVTYWYTVGGKTVRSKFQQRLMEVRSGLTGEAPDGLLFRVSSIDEQTAQGFARQQAFAGDLLAAVSGRERARLGGLAAVASRQ